MFEDGDCQEKRTFVKVDVEGNDKFTWSNLKSKLTETLFELLNKQINANSGATVNDEIKRIATSVIEFANAKLEKPSIENQKLLAEIEQILANKAKELAETRKINAEAEKIELDNTIQKLKIALGLAKMLANSTSDPDAIIFIKNIEEFSVIFSQENKLLG
jgi:hypothetical protein